MANPAPGAAPDPTARVVDRLLAQLSRTGPKFDQIRESRPKLDQSGQSRPAEGRLYAPIIRPRRAVIATLPSESMRAQARGLWARVVLGATLGVVMTQWPYPHECGWGLTGYLGAIGMVVLSGAWVGFASWKMRNGLAHLIAFMLIYWGLLLAAEQVLPRIGYAAYHASWGCVSSPVR